jgi:predicted glycosyltransferase
LPGSEQAPRDWAGWPGGKKFALVLTHDVEGQEGLAKCRQLMELERRLGYRSSFNFIPEGDYAVGEDLRQELKLNGFEVGVHDLEHDGGLYRSREGFKEKAGRINQYLKDWGADGFRSGFMLHNLDWLHDLDVKYDSSTFDTDPFEPQPDGVGTIFPFWVTQPDISGRSSNGKDKATEARRLSVGSQSPARNGLLNGYVELPYTLPQDSTLFLLFGEQTPEIWFQKLDWVAKHGGMALLGTHPDYMKFEGTEKKPWQYPVEHYEQFLKYVTARYSGQYWPALPNEVAQFVRAARDKKEKATATLSTTVHIGADRKQKPKLWIDLDNTPHVPFFEPILDELHARGFPVVVTARDAFQVCDLADKKGLRYLKIGRHHGKNRLMKGLGLVYRASQLAPVILRERPRMGVSHGSRSQLLLSNWLGTPTVLIEDYEFSQFTPMMRPTWVMAPTVIPDSALCCKNGNIRKYPGIKEDVYAWKLSPNPGVLDDLRVGHGDLVVTVRPPATEAHYHNPESETLFDAFMNRACGTPGVKVILLPRNKKQGDLIRSASPQWFQDGKTVIPRSALDGMNLIWHSDLVVSGGGTMNREAAAVGVPVYSIFRGTIGAVDQHLKSEGRLILIESVQDVQNKISLVKRSRKPLSEVTSKITLYNIVDTIEELAERSTH